MNLVPIEIDNQEVFVSMATNNAEKNILWKVPTLIILSFLLEYYDIFPSSSLDEIPQKN